MKSYEWRENILQQKREEAIGKTELPLFGRMVGVSEAVIVSRWVVIIVTSNT